MSYSLLPCWPIDAKLGGCGRRGQGAGGVVDGAREEGAWSKSPVRTTSFIELILRYGIEGKKKKGIFPDVFEL